MNNKSFFLTLAFIVTSSFLFASNIFAANPRYELFGIKDNIIGTGDDGAQDNGGVRMHRLDASIIESVVSDNGYLELININASASSSILEITDLNNRIVSKKIVSTNVKHIVNVSILPEGSYTIKVLDLDNRALKEYVLKITY